ncbi:MAG TPA: hypothetical protein VKE74_17320 [Gemmataceae bacterium]|nr:hypothetical protein [Gemmataceae bacterium]
MSRIGRFVIVLALVGVGVMLTPAPAAAQFYGGPVPGPGYGGYYLQYNYLPLNIRVGTPFGPSIGWRQSAPGPVGYWLTTRPGYNIPGYYYYGKPGSFNYSTPYTSLTGSNGSYMTGGLQYPGSNSSLGYYAQENFGRAQNQSTSGMYAPSGAKAAIAKQGEIEQGKAGGEQPPAAAPPQNLPRDLVEALSVAEESRLASGEYLNRIMAEIVALEGRGAKGASAQFSPQLLGEVRFGRSPAADAVNVIRRAGRLEFPAAFEAVAGLKALRATIDQDLVAAASPVRLGKAADPLKATKLEDDVRLAQAALTPAISSLPFEDATAARRFLNHLDAAAKVLKDPKSAGLVNPKWETEGTSVSDLVKHMSKYKLQFGPVTRGNEEAYIAVHQGLSGYLFALQQNEPKKKLG